MALGVPVIIPPFTVPVGVTVLGPVIGLIGWSQFVLTLDLAGLVSATIKFEESSDGLTWTDIIGISTIFGDPTFTPDATAAIWPSRPSSFLRATINNSVAFSSTGGSFVAS
jgi:hypothetical protein